MKKFIKEQVDSLTLAVLVSLILISGGLIYYVNHQFVNKLLLNDSQQMAMVISKNISQNTKLIYALETKAKAELQPEIFPVPSKIEQKYENLKLLTKISSYALFLDADNLVIPPQYRNNRQLKNNLNAIAKLKNRLFKDTTRKAKIHSRMTRVDNLNLHFAPLQLSNGKMGMTMLIAEPNMNGLKVAFAVKTAVKATALGAFLIITLVFLLILSRLSENIKAKKLIQYLVNNDALTNFPNRKGFYNLLGQAIVDGKETKKDFAIFSLDLDKFGQINDLHGQNVGDEILKIIATRIQETIPEKSVLARLSGDEFAIIIPNIQSSANAGEWALDICHKIAEPIKHSSEEFLMKCSIGIAFGPDGDLNADALFKQADIALGCAKADGGNTHCFYAPEMNSALHARQTLERDLNNALKNSEFVLFYQPQHNIVTGEIVGYESLVRWKHPEKGFISPNNFIPVAEETGLIVDMGIEILRIACREAMMWTNELKVAVNLSPIQFAHTDIPQLVAQTLDETGLPPSRLELEITESTLLSGTEDVLKMLTELKMLGVSIAMDDFGTGYSSLSYISQFDFDKIKIDQAFVATILEDKRAQAIINTITGLGRALDVTITAEGVENEAQLTMLKAAGCNVGQGYLFGKPAPHSVIMEQMLNSDKTANLKTG